MAKVIFIIACGLAFLSPVVLTSRTPEAVRVKAGFRQLPTHFEGRELREIGLSERETFFLEGFPGQVGRFTDGNREIIIRRVTEATRKLHPARDCFSAVGYTTTPQPINIGSDQKRWSCFLAVKDDEKLRVCERIEDNLGGEWTDVSSWYWASVWRNDGEWFAYTVAERDGESE